MAVDPIGMFAQSTSQVTTTPNGQIGKNDFLQMLVAQMKYQDPLNPMDNTQMMSQMAQFSSLEQMTNMASSFSQLSAVALLGHTIRATASTGQVITGKVVSVTPNQDIPFMTLDDGSVVALPDVQEVAY